MPDNSAVSLPAPAGAVEGLTRKSEQIPWFDGQPRQVDVYYVADGRTVALGQRVPNGSGVPSVYGEWDGGIVVRATQDPPTHLVAGQWLSGQAMVGETLLSRALGEFLPMLAEGAQSLRIDDRAALGLGDGAEGVTIDAQRWAVAVAGELTVPGLAEQIPLRPAAVTRHNDTIAFEEPGVDAGFGELTLELVLDRDGNVTGPEEGAGAPAVTLASAVSLLLDEQIDGAWERPAPLWLPTSTGLLRIGQGELERSPYLFFSESRNIDVGRWFPELGAGAQARLMLDQSGPKTLTVRQDGEGFALTLTVRQPALVFVLPGLAVDGRGLPAPWQPPGAAAMVRAVPLQLVPVHLCGDGASPWSLEYRAGMVLRWTRPGEDGRPALTHFTGHENWVLPPAAALNEVPGISTLRVLIPMLPDGDEQRFRLRAGAGEGSGAAAMRIEPLDGFGTMAPEATGFGPLASFGAEVGNDRELWPGGAASAVPEPAVLRAAYRMLPPGVAADGAPASFAATRVRSDAPSPAADLAPAATTAEDAAAHRSWTYRPGSRVAEQRDEHRTEWPGERFGWMDMQFLSPAALNTAGAPALNPALAWGELREHGGKYSAVRWVRLSDDSLTRLPAASADSRENAVTALTDSKIELPAVSLADDASQARWGLAHLRVVERIENGTSTFTLLAGPTQVEIPIEEQHGVNRIVVALALNRKVAVDIAPAVKTASLNRLFLELERRGGRLVVARGMLGWGASEAFGWRKKVVPGQDTQFHVTERFERDGDVLLRSVEYNGTLSRQVQSAQNAVDLYFWDAVQKPGATTLRVICHYRLQHSGVAQATSICALQDACLVGESLDLSADVAILQRSGASQVARLSYPWAPDRRKLYRLLFDTAPAHYVFAGFLRIRSAPTDRVESLLIGTADEARVVPAWFLCDRDLIPWFDTDPGMPVPDRDSWTAEGLLRTGPGVPGNKALNLKLYGVLGADWKQCYAATLIGTEDARAHLPLWVPSPVRVPPEGAQADTAPAEADGLLRLWLFNPGPRMVAQWPLPAIAEEDKRREAALKQALQRLWRMGWTREAVLELPRADGAGEVEWKVIDSPLLNRGASLAWFGWPLAPDAQYPRDTLPATTQVPQTSRGEQQSYSLQVEFENDLVVSEPRVNLVRDSGNAKLGTHAPDGLTFRTGGVRVGVHHKLVAYGAPPSALVAPARLGRPARQQGPALSMQGRWLAWGSEIVDLAAAGLTAMPGGVLLYTLPYPCSELRIGNAPPDLQWLSPDRGWAAVGDGEWLKLGPAEADRKAIRLKLPVSDRWWALAVTLRRDTAGPQAPGETRTLFPSSGTRLAGVFDRQGKLLAFGEEQAFYAATEQLPEQGLTSWTRITGVALPPRTAADAMRVVTIDLDGRSVESVLPELAGEG